MASSFFSEQSVDLQGLQKERCANLKPASGEVRHAHALEMLIEHRFRFVLRFETIRDDSRRFETIRDDSRRFETIRDDSRRFETIRDDSRRFETIRSPFFCGFIFQSCKMHYSELLRSMYTHDGSYETTIV